MDNPALRRLVNRLGLAPYLRPLRRVYKPQWVRLQNAEHEQMRVVLASVLSSTSCCVDIGANVGDFLRDATRCAPAGRHVAFEPLPDLAKQIRRELPHIEVHEIALSDVEGEALFNQVENASVYSSLHARRLPLGAVVNTINVRTARLDDVLSREYVPTLIKVDVEGAEYEALAGGLDTLRRHTPIVIFEHNPRHGEGAQDSTALYRLLAEEAGLRIYDLFGRGPLTGQRFSDAAREGSATNFIARS
jgi:FkbM family methyltransferase